MDHPEPARSEALIPNPPARRQRTRVAVQLLETPWGRLGLAADSHRIHALDLSGDTGSLIRNMDRRGLVASMEPAVADQAATAVTRYLRGESADVDFEVSYAGLSPFVRAVMEAMRWIPAGEVRTYAELAAAAGHPGAARPAANACARNPVPLVVPCHRVVPSAGGIGQYGGGAELKRWLLRHEGVLESA